MTFREKLAKEHPEYVNDGGVGGCNRCPFTYGYENKPSTKFCREHSCRECWDREIPEPEKKKTHTISSGIFGIPNDHAEPIHITIHTNLVSDPDAVIADVFKYVYTIKDRVVNVHIQ